MSRVSGGARIVSRSSCMTAAAAAAAPPPPPADAAAAAASASSLLPLLLRLLLPYYHLFVYTILEVLTPDNRSPTTSLPQMCKESPTSMETVVRHVIRRNPETRPNPKPLWQP